MDILGDYLPRVAESSSDFNIDLSSVLTDCMERLKANYADQESLLNFVHAAILIEKFCKIYGRNVDSLYNFVISLRESLSSRSSSKEPVQENIEADKRIRRRQILSLVSLEDFHLLPNNADKVSSKHRRQRKRKSAHLKEAAYGRLLCIKKDVSCEHAIYDDDSKNGQHFFNAGRKGEFRLNWFVGQDFALGEDVLDRGLGMSWSIYDERVTNMPTPEYSDDCEGNGSIIPDIAGDENPSPPQTLEIALVPVAREADKTLATEERHMADNQTQNEIVPDARMDNLPEQTVKHRDVFKFPAALLKELKTVDAGGTKGLTAFLFSKFLQSSLNMVGLVPKYKNKKTDSRLVAEHVKNIMKRFNLDNPRPSLSSLTEDQSDFLGFDVVSIPPPDDSDIFFGCDFHSSFTEDIQVRNAPAMRHIPENFQPATPQGLECEEIHEDPLIRNMMDYHNTREVVVGNKEVVAQWQASIESRMEKMTSQRVFDVKEYCSDIINCFSHVGQKIAFTDFAGQLNESEVCRYFVSSLMLANTENLHLEENNGPNSLELTLLNRHREWEKFLESEMGSEPIVPPADSHREKSKEMRKQLRNSKERNCNISSRPSSLIVQCPSPHISSASDVLLPCGILQASTPTAGPSGIPVMLPFDESFSSAISSISTSTLKRSCPVSESDESLKDIYVQKKGFCKQKPGEGPWVNKSKKSKHH